MPQTPKILGQNKPDAEVLTNLFTVSAGKQAAFAVFVCNQSSVMDEITISLLRATESESPATYIAYNTPILGNSVISFAGLNLNSGDQIKVVSKNGTTSFNATGMEFS